MTPRHVPVLDAAVVGLGGLGAFALRALARRGLRVAGFDRLDPPHPFGSSHGRTRILREAYFEHPLYVPLVRQALEGWHALEEESGARLFRRTGALMVGPPGGTVIPGTLASARAHGVPHRLLLAEEAARAFPGLAPAPEDAVVHEEGAGVLHPEGAIEAALRSAEAHGARVFRDAEATVGAGGRVILPGGVEAERVVLALGPWLPAFLGSASPRLHVERQISFWFELLGPVPPVGLHEYAPGRFFYWIAEPDGPYEPYDPAGGPGLVKAALHHEGAAVSSPDALDRTASPADEARLRPLVERLLTGRIGAVRRVSVCQYTNTQDGNFLVGPAPHDPRTLLLGGGSGHAFKFAPALGERVAEWVVGARGPDPNDPFLPARFRTGPAPPSASSG